MNMEFWIARDGCGTLTLFRGRPHRLANVWVEEKYDLMILDRELFPEITWDNSPVMFNLTKIT